MSGTSDDQPSRFHEGKENSHKANDSSKQTDGSISTSDYYLIYFHEKLKLTYHFSEDERSIANKLAREEQRGQEAEEKSEQAKQIEIDPTLPVCIP